jgi:peroxiredoxin
MVGSASSDGAPFAANRWCPAAELGSMASADGWRQRAQLDGEAVRLGHEREVTAP